LIKALKTGAMAAGFATELWTLPRIARLIKERFGVELSQPSVWRMLQQLGWSVQRPSGRSRERDEAAIATWKKKRWPALKNSRRGKAE
jgi:transposase